MSTPSATLVLSERFIATQGLIERELQLANGIVALSVLPVIRLTVFSVALFSCLALMNRADAAYQLDKATDGHSLTSGLLYLEDKNHQFQLSDLVGFDDSDWRILSTQNPSFGLSESKFWFKLKVVNSLEHAERYIALIDYIALDQIDYFVVDSQSGKLIRQDQIGDRRPTENRPVEYVSFALPLDLEAKQEVEVYIATWSNGNIVVPISLWQRDRFFEQQKFFFITLGFLVGMMLVTGIYNLFVYLRIRENIFLSFGLFALAVTFLFANQSGFTYLYFWPEWPLWAEFSILLAIGFATASHLFFSSSFLSFEGRTKTVAQTGMLVSLLSPWIYWMFGYAIALQSGLILALFSSIGTALLSIILAVRGVRYSRTYALAWSAFAIGSTLSALIRFDFIPYNVFTENAAFIGAVATVFIFSILVSDRINAEKGTRMEAQNAAIKSLEKYETLFRESVEGIFTCSHNGEIISMNPALLRMLSYEDIEHIKMEDTRFSKIFRDESLFNEILAEVRANHKLMDREVELIDSQRKVFWGSISMRLAESYDAQGKHRVKLEGAIININARKDSEQKLAYLASHDPLTNIYNRRDFESRLSEALSSIADGNIVHSMLYIDLDQFKVVNDTCGHSAGDKLLKELTKILVKKLGAKGVIARLGGDEFGVLLPFQNREMAAVTAESLLQVVRDYRFVHGEKVFTLGASIGLVELNTNFSSVEDVMSLADTACYTAKDEGRNRIHVYSADNIELAKRRTEMEIVTAVNTALATDRFRLARQVIATTDNPDQIIGYEILVRMLGDQDELVSPAKFIPAAERYNVMPFVDRWVLEHAFRWLDSLPESEKAGKNFSMNLSGQSLGDEKFKLFLTNLFEHHSIGYDQVCFEITETTAIQSLHNTLQFIDLFRNKGCKFSLDDFGSGFSSYGYLKNLPVDNLKIDGSFVRNMDQDKVDFTMVQSITSVAQAMGKKTIAEFVENDATIECLKQVGVDYIQGYHVGMPEIIQMPGLYNESVKKSV